MVKPSRTPIFVIGLATFAAAHIGALRGVEAANPPPRSFTLVADYDKHGLTALDQGNRPDCSLFAIVGLVEFEIDQHSPGEHPRLSEDYLIWAADQATGQTGDQAMFYKAVMGLNELGICTSTLMPYLTKPEPHHKPTAAAVANARQWRDRWQVEWIKRWSVDAPLRDAQLVDIKRALAAGHPVAAGFRWPKNLKGSDILNVPAPNQVEDGHSVALVGYEDDSAKPGGGVFTFRNSFGPNWGERGYGTVSFAYTKAYVNDVLFLRLGAPESEKPTLRFEAESMAVRAAQRCKPSPQKMKFWGAKMWSGGEQLFCPAEKNGFVELGFVVPNAGRYRVRIVATAAPDYGIVRPAIDERSVTGEFDLYCGQVSPAGSLELGTHELTAGEHRLRVTSVAKNASATNFNFGLDALDLIAVK